MNPPGTLVINGRFLTQTQTGVQRFAAEMTAELLRRHPDRVVLLAPPGANPAPASGRLVGQRSGQWWEQIELPAHLAGGLLINLGNTAPLKLHDQIVVIHDAGVFATPEAYSWKFRSWYKLVQNVLVRRGARIVTVSQFARCELAHYLRVEPHSISVVSEGADHMHRIAADTAVLHNIPPGRFVLVVGNLAAHKNLASLSALAVQLAALEINLVITGGLAGAAFNASATTALPQPACYIGRVLDSALKALYQTAECLVLPSRYEGFGLPAVEAMACGCPVVAARIPALQETCADAAAYADPTAPNDIAEQVCRLLADDSAASGLRAAGSARAATFTWQRAASQLVEIADRPG